MSTRPTARNSNRCRGGEHGGCIPSRCFQDVAGRCGGRTAFTQNSCRRRVRPRPRGGGSLAGLPDWTPLTTALDRALDNVFAVDLCKYEDKYFIYNLAAVDGGDLSRHLPKPRGSVSGASRPALSFAARTENVRMRRRAALDALADRSEEHT